MAVERFVYIRSLKTEPFFCYFYDCDERVPIFQNFYTTKHENVNTINNICMVSRKHSNILNILNTLIIFNSIVIR